MPEYRVEVYNNQPQSVDNTQQKLDRMSADGWHIHTAELAYTEFYVLWERDGSGLANRVAPHLPSALKTPQAADTILRPPQP